MDLSALHQETISDPHRTLMHGIGGGRTVLQPKWTQGIFDEGGGMSVDDLLFIIIIGGMALSIAYLRAQFVMRRSHRIAERASELRLRELYATRRKTQGLLKGSARPVSCAAVPQMSPNVVLHRSLPVHVRFVSYRSSAAADEGHFGCH
jgi:hypothetical protein